MVHTAHVKRSDPNKPKTIKGEFEVVEGELSFTCHTDNVTFNEVLTALTLLRDELNRQINNQHKCPFHPINTLEDVMNPNSFEAQCFPPY